MDFKTEKFLEDIDDLLDEFTDYKKFEEDAEFTRKLHQIIYKHTQNPEFKYSTEDK